MNGLRTAKELAENKPHGLRVKYLGGCHCVPCRASNSRYQSSRMRLHKKGIYSGIVSAERARKHIFELSEKGIGYKFLAEISGVAKSIVFKIRTGEKANIRQSTERKILAVDLDLAAKIKEAKFYNARKI